MQLTQAEGELLKQAVEATKFNTIVYLEAGAMTNLLAAGLVEGNAAMVTPEGKIAFRAKQAGVDLVSQLEPAPAAVGAPWGSVVQAPATTPAPAAEERPAATKKGVDTGIVVGHGGFVPPTKTKRRPPVTSRIYEFEKLELGSYLWVPATEAKPNPGKSLGSTVSSANKRFADHVPPRFFKVFSASAGQRFGDVVAPADGAYIVRLEPPAPKAEQVDSAAQ